MRFKLRKEETFEEHRSIHYNDRMNELWESFGQLFTDLFPKQIQVFIGNLLECCALQVDYNSDLIHLLWFDYLFAAIELITPGALQLFDDPFGDALRISALKEFCDFDLASVYYEDRPALLISFMETCRHELSYGIFLSHEVVLQEQVNLHSVSPFAVVDYPFECFLLVEVRRN